MKARIIRIEGDIAHVPLTKGYYALVDAADVPFIGGFNWCAQIAKRHDGSIRAVYAKRAEWLGGGRAGSVFLHRMILGLSGALEADHIDGDGLNNRRINLREATSAQNKRNARIGSANTSGVKGVGWEKSRNKWTSYITYDSKLRFLGYFNCRTAAQVAYAKASADLHGEFGRLA